MALQVVILAAGKGSRMASDIPKVLHRVGGVSMLERVVHTAEKLKPKVIHVIYGNGGEKIKKELSHLRVKWVLQKQQLGTGHAVKKVIPKISARDQVLVLYADVPIISSDSLEYLLSQSPLNGVGLMVTEVADPTGFGRIIRSEMANIESIVEHRDADAEQLHIKEINTGILTTTAAHLKSWLPKLNNKNKQKEYYLTDIVRLAVKEGVPVGGVMVEPEEVQGVNDPWQLACIEKSYQKTVAKSLAMQGVTLLDWNSLQVRGLDFSIAKQVTIDSRVTIEGKVKIGKHVSIGAGVHLKDVVIGDHVEILPGSIIEGAIINNNARIGPYARIRPQTKIEEYVQVGNFVEVKNSTIKRRSKANHLSYLGDSYLGERVNIGAGTITCNYNGSSKFKTHIDDRAFVGSNTSLVAPVLVGEGATIGAGSVVVREAPENQITISRPEQKSIPKRKKPSKKSK